MALQKITVNEVGVSTTYYRIGDIYQNFINPEPHLVVYVIGYADEGYRETEKSLNDKDIQKSNFYRHFELPIDDSKGYSRADIYGRLKNEVPMFDGATDV